MTETAIWDNQATQHNPPCAIYAHGAGPRRNPPSQLIHVRVRHTISGFITVTATATSLPGRPEADGSQPPPASVSQR